MTPKKEKAAPGKATAQNTVQSSHYQSSVVASSKNALDKAVLLIFLIAGENIPNRPHVWQQVERTLRQHYRCGEGQP